MGDVKKKLTPEERFPLIVEAITEYYGERCPDVAIGCPCCEAWIEFDNLTSSAIIDTLQSSEG